jgi:hypothetical protein
VIAPNGNILVRVGSHRARHRLAQAIGAKIQSWYSFYHSGYLAEVPPDKLADAVAITGITKANIKDLERRHPCISWS